MSAHTRRLLAASALAFAGTAIAVRADARGPATVPPPTSGTPAEYVPGDPSFFEVPDPIPEGVHGTLLRFQGIDSAFSRTWRIMYLSTSATDRPTVITGLVDAPDASTGEIPFGGYPVLLYGHRSLGLTDDCAPSVTIDDDRADFSSLQGSDGWVVAATDYEGLGGPGGHPYLVGVSEARSMLDAGLAARQIPGLYTNDSTALVGFEAGGHGALWAAQLAAEWTPSQQLVGTVAAAPVADPATWIGAGRTDLSEEAQTLAIVAGLAAADLQAAVSLTALLTPAGVEALSSLESGCFDDDLALPEGPYFTADPSTTEPFAALMAANVAGTVASPAPLLVFHAPGDSVVPIAQSEALTQRLCAAGQVVELRPLADDAAHGVTHTAATTDGVDWLSGLVDGTATATTTC